MAIKIVDLPINSMVIFHSFSYVYQRVNITLSRQTSNFPGVHDNHIAVRQSNHVVYWTCCTMYSKLHVMSKQTTHVSRPQLIYIYIYTYVYPFMLHFLPLYVHDGWVVFKHLLLQKKNTKTLFGLIWIIS